jgi:hypothetical protein
MEWLAKFAIGIFLQNLACNRNKLENAKPRGCYAADLSTMQKRFFASIAFGCIWQDMPNLVPYLPKIRLPVMAILICAGLMTSLIQSRIF